MGCVPEEVHLGITPRNRMLRYNAANTSIEPVKRSSFEEGPLTDKDRYQSLVGKLIYLTNTKLDLGFALHVNPTNTHMKVLNKILQYLKGTPSRGKYFKKSLNKDSQLLAIAPLSGKTWLLGESRNNPWWLEVVQKLNSESWHMNLVFHDRTKHVEIDQHFIKEKIDHEIIMLSMYHRAISQWTF
ncbi:hypothetical protein CR513_22329, partial [Mucuna pruriens]